MESIWWLLLFVVLILFELMTAGVTTIWFAAGALAAYIAALLGAQLWVQAGIFITVSIVLIIGLRPFVSRFLVPSGIKTNVDSLIGETAKITVMVNNQLEEGRAMLRGQEWSVRSAEDKVIPPGSLVTVKEVCGVKLIVRLK